MATMTADLLRPDTIATTLRPLSDRVVILPEPLATSTASGLLIPGTANANRRPSRGLVLAVGPGKPDGEGGFTPVNLWPGDTVLYSRYSGHDIQEGTRDLRLLSSDDILGVVE